MIGDSERKHRTVIKCCDTNIGLMKTIQHIELGDLPCGQRLKEVPCEFRRESVAVHNH